MPSFFRNTIGQNTGLLLMFALKSEATAEFITTSSSSIQTIIASCSGSIYLLSWQGLVEGRLAFFFSLEFKQWRKSYEDS